MSWNGIEEAKETGADSMKLPWYALRIKSNFEKTTARILSQKGYDQFLPIYQKRSRWSDRVKLVELPLFPGYLFCRFDANARLPVLVTPGVVGVVGMGKLPIAVSEEEVAAVQAVVASGLPASPWPFVEVGERVVIERGPLAGVEGILENVKNSYRFVVSVNLLQRAVATEVDSDWIRPAGSGSRRQSATLISPQAARANARLLERA